jgi:hypothetical protein
LHARLLGYFWLPCDVCGRPFSGWEWGREGFTIRGPIDWNDGVGFQRGRGVCSKACEISGQLEADPEWQRQMAESRVAFEDWQARGCPEDELATVDQLRQRLGLGGNEWAPPS